MLGISVLEEIYSDSVKTGPGTYTPRSAYVASSIRPKVCAQLIRVVKFALMSQLYVSV